MCKNSRRFSQNTWHIGGHLIRRTQGAESCSRKTGGGNPVAGHPVNSDLSSPSRRSARPPSPGRASWHLSRCAYPLHGRRAGFLSGGGSDGDARMRSRAPSAALSDKPRHRRLTSARAAPRPKALCMRWMSAISVKVMDAIVSLSSLIWSKPRTTDATRAVPNQGRAGAAREVGLRPLRL